MLHHTDNLTKNSVHVCLSVSLSVCLSLSLSCARGMIYNKIHLISPSCPLPTSIALRCRMVASNTIHLILSLSPSLSLSLSLSVYAFVICGVCVCVCVCVCFCHVCVCVSFAHAVWTSIVGRLVTVCLCLFLYEREKEYPWKLPRFVTVCPVGGINANQRICA